MIKDIITQEDRSVVAICSNSVIAVFNYLGIEKDFYLSSELECSSDLSAADRLINISKILSCNKYVNSIGGITLYSKPYFKEHDIDLFFIKNDIEYKQMSNEFIPNLSIIDVLMWNDKETIKKLLNNYVLV